jgi:hypothetical protein
MKTISTLRAFGAIAVALLLATLPGCGDSPEKSISPGVSAEQMLEQVAAHVGAVKSITFAATPKDAINLSRVVGTVNADGSFIGTLAQNGGVGDLIVVGHVAYVRGTKLLWMAGEGATWEMARALAGRWVKVPRGTGVEDAVEQFAPSTMAYCLVQTAGTLSADSPAPIDGRDVIVLHDSGDKPGTARGQLHIAARGAPLPVALISTGDYTPGPVDPRCGNAGEPPIAAEVRFEAFDRDVNIAPPHDALDLEALSRGDITLQSRRQA